MITWPKLRFGKHEGKTLPWVVLHDPDWVFWASEKGALTEVHRARELVKKAQRIRVPDGNHGSRVADYILHMSGKLSHVEVGYPGDMHREEDRGVWRESVLDLSAARRVAGGKDKTGATAILSAVRRSVFEPRGWSRITAARAEEFFNDDSNFLL